MDTYNTHTQDYYLVIKKWNIAICSNMDGPRDHYTEWSQRKINIIQSYWYLKNYTNECIYKTEIGLQTEKRNVLLSKGKGKAEE